MDAEFWARIDRWLAENPPPESAPPRPPPAPTPEMDVRQAVIYERRRLRFLGRVTVVDQRTDGSVRLHVARENGNAFSCLAASDDPADVCTAVDQVLTRRVERERAIEARHVAHLRQQSRRLEDDADRRGVVDQALERHGATPSARRLAALEHRRDRVDGELFAIKEAAR